VAELLLERGALIDAGRDERRQTPLQAACEADHVEVAVLLVSKGADARGVLTYGCAEMFPERDDALTALATISTVTGLAPDLADLVVGYRYASRHSDLAQEYADVLEQWRRCRRLRRFVGGSSRKKKKRKLAQKRKQSPEASPSSFSSDETIQYY
jgi:hypothetical protein